MTTAHLDRDASLELNLQSPASTRVVFYTNLLSDLDTVARSVFAIATPCTVMLSDPGWPRGLATQFDGRTAGSGEVDLHEAESAPDRTSTAIGSEPTVVAVEELRAWLGVTYEDLAKMLGWQSASVLHHWRRNARSNEPVRPRATSAEPVLRLHAFLRAVMETISGGVDVGALRAWTCSPLSPAAATPLQLLRRGRLDELERAAAPLIFGETKAPTPDWQTARIEEDAEVAAQPPTHYSVDDFG